MQQQEQDQLSLEEQELQEWNILEKEKYLAEKEIQELEAKMHLLMGDVKELENLFIKEKEEQETPPDIMRLIYCCLILKCSVKLAVCKQLDIEMLENQHGEFDRARVGMLTMLFIFNQ